MFQNAYGRLENTVMPILTAWLTSEGQVAWDMGAGLIVNKGGGFITAAHTLDCVSRPQGEGDPLGPYSTEFGTTEATFDGGHVHEEIDFPYLARAWMETSSPGLGGPSGGPVVDEYGLVCGIQVNTQAWTSIKSQEFQR